VGRTIPCGLNQPSCPTGTPDRKGPNASQYGHFFFFTVASVIRLTQTMPCALIALYITGRKTAARWTVVFPIPSEWSISKSLLQSKLTQCSHKSIKHSGD